MLLNLEVHIFHFILYHTFWGEKLVSLIIAGSKFPLKMEAESLYNATNLYENSLHWKEIANILKIPKQTIKTLETKYRQLFNSPKGFEFLFVICSFHGYSDNDIKQILENQIFRRLPNGDQNTVNMDSEVKHLLPLNMGGMYIPPHIRIL